MSQSPRNGTIAGLIIAAVFLTACGSVSGTTTSTLSSLPTTAASDGTSPSNSTADVTTTTTTTTTPAPQPTNILVIGDFGDGGGNERAVAAAMEEYATMTPIAALVTTGDNLYTDDVAAAWEEPFGWVAAMGIPVYAAWGNHDLESSSRGEAVMATLAPPGRWYEAQLGEATLIVLDANEVENPDQVAWLESVLIEARNGPLVVSFHQPAFSCAKHGSTEEVISTWVPLFETHGVDLVLNGHDHDYERFELNGVTYVVTGGGGRALYSIGTCPGGTPQPVVGDDTHYHFVGLHITADGITVEALTPDGEVIDEFSVPLHP